MLSGDQVVVDPRSFAVELHERESPPAGGKDILDAAPEPRRLQLLIYAIIRFPVSLELYVQCQHGLDPFVDDAGQVRVHQYVAVQVIQFEPA